MADTINNKTVIFSITILLVSVVIVFIVLFCNPQLKNQ